MSKHALRHEMDSILSNIGEGYHAKQAPPPLPSDEWEFEDNEAVLPCDCGEESVGIGANNAPVCKRCRDMATKEAKKYGFRDGTLKWCSCCTVRLAASGLSLCARRECREKAGYWT